MWGLDPHFYQIIFDIMLEICRCMLQLNLLSIIRPRLVTSVSKVSVDLNSEGSFI